MKVIVKYIGLSMRSAHLLPSLCESELEEGEGGREGGGREGDE